MGSNLHLSRTESIFHAVRRKSETVQMHNFSDSLTGSANVRVYEDKHFNWSQKSMSAGTVDFGITEGADVSIR
jgi:hypothetical protein